MSGLHRQGQPCCGVEQMLQDCCMEHDLEKPCRARTAWGKALAHAQRLGSSAACCFLCKAACKSTDVVPFATAGMQSLEPDAAGGYGGGSGGGGYGQPAAARPYGAPQVGGGGYGQANGVYGAAPPGDQHCEGCCAGSGHASASHGGQPRQAVWKRLSRSCRMHPRYGSILTSAM